MECSNCYPETMKTGDSPKHSTEAIEDANNERLAAEETTKTTEEATTETTTEEATTEKDATEEILPTTSVSTRL